MRLFVATAKRQPMLELNEVRAIANRGLEGCVHGRPGSRRQVLLIEEEILNELGLHPGTVRENITTEGMALGEVVVGQRLRVGEALLEMTMRCEPCDRMDEIRPGLREELLGRRGMLCRVVEGGLIRRGDPVEVMERAGRASRMGGDA